MHEDLVRLGVFACVKVRECEQFVIASHAVVNQPESLTLEQSRLKIHRGDVERIARPIASRIALVDVPKPVELSVRVLQQLGAGAGRIERLAIRVGPGFRLRPFPPAVGRE